LKANCPVSGGKQRKSNDSIGNAHDSIGNAVFRTGNSQETGMSACFYCLPALVQSAFR